MSLTETKGQSRYKKILIFSLATVFALIFIGGLVRSTGAGMGCPDWPRCFGRFVPPTDASQLPPDYRERYRNEYSNKEMDEFNFYKTWTEYLNRLFGGLTALATLALSLASLHYRKTNPKVTYLSFASFFLIICEAILGAIVVKMHLAHKTVTIHLLLAFLIVGVLMAALIEAFYNKEKSTFSFNTKSLNRLAVVTTILLLGQIILGTFVRGEIDEISSQIETLARSDWTAHAEKFFPVHRSFSILITVLVIVLAIGLRNISKFAPPVRNAAYLLLACTGGQIATGVLLDRFGFPAAAQPLHILLSSGMFGALVFIYMYNSQFATPQGVTQ